MLLSKFLFEPEVQEVFEQHLGDIKPLFTSFDGEAFSDAVSMVSSPPPNVSASNLNNVSIAYRFFLKAFIKHEHAIGFNENDFATAFEGLKIASDSSSIDFDMYTSIQKILKNTKSLYDSYCLGETVNMMELFAGILTATYCQNVFYCIPNNSSDLEAVNQFELLDFMNLAKNTFEKPPIFLNLQEPKTAFFSSFSDPVEKKNPDFILDQNLIVINNKTDNSFNSLDIYELLAYYFLDVIKNNGKTKIKTLGIYFSRYNQYVFSSIKAFNSKELDKLYFFFEKAFK